MNAPTGTDPAPAPGPRSLLDLYLTFNTIALSGFGGVLPWIQRVLVERKGWLTNAQLIELFSLGQVLPGPNVCNLSLMFGHRHFGLRGALVALAGMMGAPLVIAMTLAILYGRYSGFAEVRNVLAGMAAAAAGLVIAAGIKLLRSRGRHPQSWLFAALAFGAVGLARWPLPWVLAALGLVSMAAAWASLPAEEAQ
jgi:chromate transporter